MNSLAELIQNRRNAKGWTQDDLAEAMGVSRGYIGQIETGLIRRPRPRFRDLFEKTLGISREEWLRATDGLASSPPADVMAEIRRIAQIRDLEDQVAELRQLPPEVVDVLEALALGLVRQTFRQARE